LNQRSEAFAVNESIVLLIDDQRIVAEAIRRELDSESDIDFHYCQDPTRAIEEALKVGPTVILLDMVMPGVDGLMLLRFFRGHPQLKTVPVVMLSSNDDPETKAKAFTKGANDYLVKIPHKVEMIARIRYHSQAYRTILERDAVTAELRRSNAKLEELSRIKGEFVATMSHEIRTPLNGILGIAELLSQEDLNAIQSHYVQVLRNSGAALLDLINDVLDFSKIEAGKMELESVEFNLDHLLDEILQLNAHSAQDKGLELVGQVQPEVPLQLCGDPLRLRQMLSNLTGNALKFTSEGYVSVEISLAEPVSGDHVMLRVEIKDSGIGISPESQLRLFQEFAQADTSTARKYGGTGLGLTITRQLVELMGGQIGVNSQAGQGSTFWFTARFTLQPNQKARPKLDLRVTLAGLRPMERQTLRDILSEWGVTVQVVNSRAELVGNTSQLVLLDESWADAAAKLPVCLLIGLGRRAPEGIERVLFKPAGRQELLSQLQRSRPSEVAPVVAGLHLLMAEDNRTNQLVARGMLSRLGHRVEVVNNGMEAVEAAAKNDYDGILMDCGMPEMDGFEATRQIRLQPRERRIPIIAMTAYSLQEEKDHALACGMDDVITKPVNIQVLKDTLERRIPCV
jgi:signal transduction histidine kinase